MRKIIFFCIVLSFCSTISFAAKEGINIEVNGKKLEMEHKPIANYGHTLVPSRAFLEALDYQVIWDEKKRAVIATGDRQLIIKMGSKNVYLDEQALSMNRKSVIWQNRSYIPLRDIAEALGAKVTWDQKQQRIYVSLNKTANLSAYGLPADLGQLKELYGDASRITKSIYGFDWHCYHSHYKNFVMYGIRNQQVVAVYTKNPSLVRELHLKRGECYEELKSKFPHPIKSITRGENKYSLSNDNVQMYQEEQAYLRLFLDQLANKSLAAVMLTTKQEEENLSSYDEHKDEVMQRDFEMQLYDLANADRVYYGLPPLLWLDGLDEVARAHSEDMKSNNYVAHLDLEGNNLERRLEKLGYKGIYSAENIAAGQISAILAHEELMNSASHRSAILGPASFMATGIAFGGSHKNYFTEAFYTPFVQ